MKYEAIGIVEALYFTTASEILDQMCKAANVQFLTSEKYLGGQLVTQIVGGSISDVTTAIQVAKEVCSQKPVNPLRMALMISNPHQEILKYIEPKSEVENDGTNQQGSSDEKITDEHTLEESRSVPLENVEPIKVVQQETPPKPRRQRRTK